MARIKSALWIRSESDMHGHTDMHCPICLDSYGGGLTFAYLCLAHPTRGELVGTRTYWCPRHQREVSPLMMVGTDALALALSGSGVSLPA